MTPHEPDPVDQIDERTGIINQGPYRWARLSVARGMLKSERDLEPSESAIRRAALRYRDRVQREEATLPIAQRDAKPRANEIRCLILPGGPSKQQHLLLVDINSVLAYEFNPPPLTEAERAAGMRTNKRGRPLGRKAGERSAHLGWTPQGHAAYYQRKKKSDQQHQQNKNKD